MPMTSPTDLRHALQAAGVPLVIEVALATGQDPAEAAESLGWPVVVKGNVAGIAHKTEAGLVRVGISSAEELRECVTAMRTTIENLDTEVPADASITLELMAEPGAELLVSVRRVPSVGCLLTIGLGGVLVEVTRTVAVRVLPITPEDVADMLDEIHLAGPLANWRGLGRLDVPALLDCVTNLAQWFADRGEDGPEELEINPVIVHRAGAGCTAVDVLAVLD